METKVVIEKDFEGILRSPDFLFSDTPYQDQLSPPTQKVALIISGYGDYDSTHITELASILSLKLGLYSLRIRIPHVQNKDYVWQTLEKGVAYINAAVSYITSTNNDIDLNLWSIIGYYDGAAMMFAWAIKQNDLYYSKILEDRKQAIVVPNLINCSSRFYLNASNSRNKTLLSDEGGEYEKMYISAKPLRLKQYRELDFSKLCQLTTETSVLSIYGSHDDNNNDLHDASHFANILNRGRYSHHLTFIPDADQYSNDMNATKNNVTQTLNYKHSDSNRIDHNNKANEVIVDYLRPGNEIRRFFSTSLRCGDSFRWQLIEGISNFRDIGGWRIDNPRYLNTNEYLYVKSNVAFRCASMDNIFRDSGLKKLQELGITTIFDFRTKSEAKRCIKNTELQTFGLTRIHSPFEIEEKKNPREILESFTKLLTSWYTYTSVYENMLVQSTDVYKKIFEFIRDKVLKGEKFVFHCSAGKDRTGIVCMLVLLFMGVKRNTIAREYGLTAIGLKPEFENIRKKYLAGIEIFQKHETYAKFESQLKQGRTDWSVETDGFNNLVSSRCETMLATMSLIDKKFNGIDNYLKEYVGLTEEDLKIIYINLVQSEKNT